MKRERRRGGGGGGGGVEVRSGIRVIKFVFCADLIRVPLISIRLPHSWPSLLISSAVAPCISVCYLTSLWLTPPPSFFPLSSPCSIGTRIGTLRLAAEKNGKYAKLGWCRSVLRKWKSPFNPNNLTVPMKTIKLRLQTILCCRWLALTQSWEKEHVTSLLFRSVFFSFWKKCQAHFLHYNWSIFPPIRNTISDGGCVHWWLEDGRSGKL